MLYIDCILLEDSLKWLREKGSWQLLYKLCLWGLQNINFWRGIWTIYLKYCDFSRTSSVFNKSCVSKTESLLACECNLSWGKFRISGRSHARTISRTLMILCHLRRFYTTTERCPHRQGPKSANLVTISALMTSRLFRFFQHIGISISYIHSSYQ